MIQWFFSLSPDRRQLHFSRRSSQTLWWRWWRRWIQHEAQPIDFCPLNWPSSTQVKQGILINDVLILSHLQNRIQCGCTPWSPLDVHLSSLWSSQWASFGECRIVWLLAQHFSYLLCICLGTANQQSNSGKPNNSRMRWDRFRCVTLDRPPPFCSLKRRSPCRGSTSTMSFKEARSASF